MSDAERDRDGRVALHHAALVDDLELAQRLIAAGQDPSAADNQGFTPLHFAAQEGSLRAARLLLDEGADVDATNVYGNTPLHTAVFNSRGEGEMIELLRSHGADAKKPSKSGQTPVELARLIGNYDVAQFFEDVPD